MTMNNSFKNPVIDWMNYASAFTQMSFAAGEIIFLRTLRMATGAMTPGEAMGMMMEKSTVFADATERAAVAAARGGDVTNILTEALAPYGAKTRSNIRKLRK
jgi:hypothetical protein